MRSAGLEAVFLENRAALLRFLQAHGAGDAAEDLLHDLWLRVHDAPDGPVAQPLSYLYRAANNVMLDRYRSQRQTVIRERDWSDATGATVPDQSDAPTAERILIAREGLTRAQTALSGLGSRIERAFRRHRIHGASQRDVAAELGISLSTVESDLRKATRVMIEVRKSLDED